jgi:hypothetical protein
MFHEIEKLLAFFTRHRIATDEYVSKTNVRIDIEFVKIAAKDPGSVDHVFS